MPVNWTLQNDVLIIESETPNILSFDSNDPPLSSWRLKKGLIVNGFLPDILKNIGAINAFLGDRRIKNMYVGNLLVTQFIIDEE